ncbi:Acetaldehyde dehydrogenase (Acetylating) [Petrocella atlantisensis]|uniref:Acetaldehyde dehydrogenase (Acetylating) n=1 Tax=Petrocella atlantisensis TaxID=2173034 RepID=A0A3P7P4A3_9FIRM|nr:Acetaldehyde dehydrogenase (Acetylating) [Petrocella atlantisensis]
MIKDKDLSSIQDVRDLVEKAKEAQHELKMKSQEEIDAIVKAMYEVAYMKSDQWAKMAVEETGFGVYEHKIIKNKFASKAVYEFIKDMKTVGIIKEDKHKKIIEIGTPVGVIAGLVPSTNPTSTAIYKALIAVKSGNAIIFSPHPKALNCISDVARVMEAKAVEAGAPKGIIGCMAIPTLEGTDALMKHKDVSLILATGGSAMVKAAYSSGTPALGVGPGNVPAFIERSADIALSVKRIMDSKTFDNGTICASEQAVVTENCIKDQVKTEFIKAGAYFLEGEEADLVGKTIQDACGRFNAKIAGKSAIEIAQMAGLYVPGDTRVLIAEQTHVGIQYPFSREKLAPILAFYAEDNWEKACEKCMELLAYYGLGHSLVIHSKDEEVIKAFALKKPVSRLLVNTSSAQGAIGATTNLAPSLTLGCGAVGGSSTSDNVSPLNLINIRSVAYGTKELEDIQQEYEDGSSRHASSHMELDVETITKMVLKELQNYK